MNKTGKWSPNFTDINDNNDNDDDDDDDNNYNNNNYNNNYNDNNNDDNNNDDSNDNNNDNDIEDMNKNKYYIDNKLTFEGLSVYIIGLSSWDYLNSHREKFRIKL